MYRNKTREYFDLSICRKCYEKLGLDSLENTSIEDPFMKELIADKDQWSSDALNAFASTFPVKYSKDLLGMCLANIDDEDMDGLAVSSFITSARSVLLFGSDTGKVTDPNGDKLHFLLALTNLIEISIVASLGRRYKESGLEIESDSVVADIEIESLMTTLDILNEIRNNDSRKELREEIIEMFAELTGHDG